MKSFIGFLAALITLYPIKPAIAISENELMTNDGNVWAVYDKLETDREYTVIFDSLGDDNIYNDKVIMII